MGAVSQSGPAGLTGGGGEEGLGAGAFHWWGKSPRHSCVPASPASHGHLSKRLPTSRLVELQGDVGIKAQAEVVVEDVQRQLRKGQGTSMRVRPHRHLPAPGPAPARALCLLSHTFQRPFLQFTGSSRTSSPPPACLRLCPLGSPRCPVYKSTPPPHPLAFFPGFPSPCAIVGRSSTGGLCLAHCLERGLAGCRYLVNICQVAE